MYYLSFDCATKTFAFSVSWLDLEGFASGRRGYREEAAAIAREIAVVEELLRRGGQAGAGRLAEKMAELSRRCEDLDRRVGGHCRIIDGETTDLCPGRPDSSISTVDRIRAMVRYISARVLPSVDRHCPTPPRVLIEFQMGPNARARAIAAALVAVFVDYETAFVGPTLKNRVSIADNQYYRFAEKYSTTYGANKSHAKANFAALEALFGSSIPASSAAERGHIADSFMQVVGYVVHGNDIEAASLMF